MKKIVSISFLTLLVLALVQIMPAPIQNEVEAFKAGGECSTIYAKFRFIGCIGATTRVCRTSGDCPAPQL